MIFLTDWHNRDNWLFNSTTCLHTQGCNLSVQKINDWYTLLVHEQLASPQDIGTPGCFLTLHCYVRSQIKSTHTCQDIMVLCFTTSNWMYKPSWYLVDHNQRREDMTSCRSDNLDALITLQGQESRMQVTRMALWTKSRWALSVFY